MMGNSERSVIRGIKGSSNQKYTKDIRGVLELETKLSQAQLFLYEMAQRDDTSTIANIKLFQGHYSPNAPAGALADAK
jgi:hypothetical protein